MPVRNEAGFIARSLGSVLGQDYPLERIEVIVADGMSTDGTRELVRAARSRHPGLLLIDNPGRIVPTGLNTALRVARGGVVIRIDGHCEIARDYVARCVHHLARDGVDAVGGAVTTVGANPLAQAIALAMSSLFGVGGSAFRMVKGKTLLVDTVAFPAYTREVLERAGPFDEELVRNQDDEYNYRLRRQGGRILLAADVQSRYYSRGSFRSLWRQYFQYGYWKVRVMQKHPRQMRPRQFVPPGFVASLLVSLLTAPFSPVGGSIFAFVACSYLLANLVASVLSVREGQWRLLPFLPAAYATLHLAYGLGFLIGLLHFAGRWGDRGTGVRKVSVEGTGRA